MLELVFELVHSTQLLSLLVGLTEVGEVVLELVFELVHSTQLLSLLVGLTEVDEVVVDVEVDEGASHGPQDVLPVSPR